MHAASWYCMACPPSPRSYLRTVRRRHRRGVSVSYLPLPTYFPAVFHRRVSCVCIGRRRVCASMTWYLRLVLGLADAKSPFLRLSLIAFLYYSLLAVGVVGNVFSGASGRVPLYGVLWSCMAPLLYVYTPSPLLSLYSLLVSCSAPLYTALESVCVVLLAEAASRYLHRFICSSDSNTSSSAKAAVLILSAAGVLLSYVSPYAQCDRLSSSSAL